MKIGFDLDGVITESEIVGWYQFGKDQDMLGRQLLVKRMRPVLSPHLFLHEDDEGFIITGRIKELQSITKEWCAKYFPNLTLVCAPTPVWTSKSHIQEWREDVAKHKAKILRELNIDVYFEDMPEVVRLLRKLCPEITIIQFGGTLR